MSWQVISLRSSQHVYTSSINIFERSSLRFKNNHETREKMDCNHLLDSMRYVMYWGLCIFPFNPYTVLVGINSSYLSGVKVWNSIKTTCKHVSILKVKVLRFLIAANTVRYLISKGKFKIHYTNLVMIRY